MLQIVCGHFGSGKTELSIALALAQKATIVDMDIVNPYFRTSDVREALEARGVSVIAPEFASTNVDIPTLPAEILSVFSQPRPVVFDVGGDRDGAYALGRFAPYFHKEPYEMLFVINACRPLTQSTTDIIDYIREIEAASRLSVTEIVNTTNLGRETTADTVRRGRALCREVSAKTGIPFRRSAARQDIAAALEFPTIPLSIWMDVPFE